MIAVYERLGVFYNPVGNQIIENLRIIMTRVRFIGSICVCSKCIDACCTVISKDSKAVNKSSHADLYKMKQSKNRLK